MGSYLEQSKNMFVQMQEQMAKQAGSLFPGLPGIHAAEALRRRASLSGRAASIGRASAKIAG